jgi:hypothetical protein
MNFLVVVQQILPYIFLGKNKFQNKNINKKLFVLDGVLMGKL